jgi:hypothetical protein
MMDKWVRKRRPLNLSTVKKVQRDNPRTIPAEVSQRSSARDSGMKVVYTLFHEQTVISDLKKSKVDPQKHPDNDSATKIGKLPVRTSPIMY